MPPRLGGNGMEALVFAAGHYEGVETAYGGSRSRDKAAWGWGSREGWGV